MKRFSKLYLSAVLMLLAGGNAWAKKVEITLIDNLDGYLSGYCLDIVGGGDNIDPSKGLQLHTCYSYKGSLGPDQTFDSKQFENNRLYMPKYDLCAQLSALGPGARVGLAKCSDDLRQQFSFEEPGPIRASGAEDLCLTASLDTQLGRGGTSEHQIKGLSLKACSEDRLLFQIWRSRSSAD